MGRFDKFCQSCGMPMEKDPEGGGTEADGTKSTKYCSLCYDEGEFRDNFTTSKEMIDFVKEELRKQGVSGLKLWFYTSHIKQLERWKK